MRRFSANLKTTPTHTLQNCVKVVENSNVDNVDDLKAKIDDISRSSSCTTSSIQKLVAVTEKLTQHFQYDDPNFSIKEPQNSMSISTNDLDYYLGISVLHSRKK